MTRREIIDRLEINMTGINVETTNICNADCTFCAYQYQERPTGVMSMQLYKKILREFIECGGGNLSLTPTVGDPLVDPHIVERIRLARCYPEIANVGTYTNLILLGRSGAMDIVTSGLNSLTISTSGFDEKMYRRVYRSPLYRRVLNNIKELVEVNKGAGEPVQLWIDMRVDRPLREVYASSDYQEISSILGAHRISVKFQYDSWAGKIHKDQLTGNMRVRSNHSWRHPRVSPCKELYNGPTIYWDGKVGACSCRDVNASELIIGNINDSHLADIWFGEKIKGLRAEFLTPQIREICKKCSHYANLSHYVLPEYRRAELDQIDPPPVHLSQK